ncbi:hypothetical protein IKP85_07465 [bacterium]|nr:hypothetical protein [bacterium]
MTDKDKKIKISDKKLLEYIKANSSYEKTLYLDLGVKIVRLICYSDLFIPHIEKQLTYTLLEKSWKYDGTIILWQENDIEHIHENKKLFVSDADSDTGITHIMYTENTTTLCVPQEETYFYGVNNLEPEEFVKEGHIFVYILNKILKTDSTALVHGACIGFDNKGILFCARGQRGKSTLTVLSLLSGFEYVSDDYLTIEKEDDKLFAYPIYSIITLSPKMYNEMYDKLSGARFVSNNARKDKYVFNIANMHDQFKKKYPVKFCMTLEFSKEENPSIVECSKQEKGSAITQMVHSTVIQMKDMYDSKTIKKLIDMISNYKYYKMYLCRDIYKNVEYLKRFLKEYKDD